MLQTTRFLNDLGLRISLCMNNDFQIDTVNKRKVFAVLATPRGEPYFMKLSR